MVEWDEGWRDVSGDVVRADDGVSSDSPLTAHAELVIELVGLALGISGVEYGVWSEGLLLSFSRAADLKLVEGPVE